MTDLVEAIDAAGSVVNFVNAKFQSEEDFDEVDALLTESEWRLSEIEEEVADARDAMEESNAFLLEAMTVTREEIETARDTNDDLARDYQMRITDMKDVLRDLHAHDAARFQLQSLEINDKFAKLFSEVEALRQNKDDQGAVNQLWEMFGELTESKLILEETSTADHRQDLNELFDAIESCATTMLQSTKVDLETQIAHMLETEGWPMKAPEESSLDSKITMTMIVLLRLQMAVISLNKMDDIKCVDPGGYTKSWALGTVLRGQITRFRYHFRAKDSATGRNDHPEWACKFVVDRVKESVEFCQRVVDPALKSETVDPSFGHSGLVEYSMGLVEELARKITTDLGPAIEDAAGSEATGNVVISIAELARNTDERIEAILTATGDVKLSEVPSLSGTLMREEAFLHAWIDCEKQRADASMRDRMILLLSTTNSENEDLGEEEDEFANELGRSPRLIWSLNHREMQKTLFDAVEVSLLSSVRGELRNTVEATWGDSDEEVLRKTTRVLSICSYIARALRERGDEPEYVALYAFLVENESDNDGEEHALVGSLFDEESAEYERFLEEMLERIRRDVLSELKFGMKAYINLVRFGELKPPSLEGVLAYDLTGELCQTIQTLESRFSLIADRVTNAKTRSLIWRPLAEAIDEYLLADVVLLMFAGGPKSSVSPVQEHNDYLSPEYTAKACRQIAHDLDVVVRLFEVFTQSPHLFLWRTFEAISIMREAADTLEGGEPADALLRIDVSDPTDEEEKMLRLQFGADRLGKRELLEILVACGVVEPAGLALPARGCE